MDPSSSITAVLLASGLPGVVIIALGYVCVRLYNRNQELTDKRVADAQEYAKGLSQATQQIRENTEAVERVTEMWTQQRGGR